MLVFGCLVFACVGSWLHQARKVVSAERATFKFSHGAEEREQTKRQEFKHQNTQHNNPNNQSITHNQHLQLCSIMFTLSSVLASLKKLCEEVSECPIIASVVNALRRAYASAIMNAQPAGLIFQHIEHVAGIRNLITL